MRVLSKVLVLTLSAAASSAVAGESRLDWLSGSWCGGQGEQQLEEVWLSQADGNLLGMARTLSGGKLASFEFMRIQHESQRATLYAQPRGAPATAFNEVERGEGWIRFENAAHDFPNQIEYRREGEQLRAWIAGPGREGKPLRIDFDYEACPR